MLYIVLLDLPVLCLQRCQYKTWDFSILLQLNVVCMLAHKSFSCGTGHGITWLGCEETTIFVWLTVLHWIYKMQFPLVLYYICNPITLSVSIHPSMQNAYVVCLTAYAPLQPVHAVFLNWNITSWFLTIVCVGNCHHLKSKGVCACNSFYWDVLYMRSASDNSSSQVLRGRMVNILAFHMHMELALPWSRTVPRFSPNKVCDYLV